MQNQPTTPSNPATLTRLPPEVETILRLLLAIVVPLLIAHGYIDATASTDLISLINAVAALGWGIWNARQNKHQVAVAIAMPLDSAPSQVAEVAKTGVSVEAVAQATKDGATAAQVVTAAKQATA